VCLSRFELLYDGGGTLTEHYKTTMIAFTRDNGARAAGLVRHFTTSALPHWISGDLESLVLRFVRSTARSAPTTNP
jgi:hypothetical protein